MSATATPTAPSPDGGEGLASLSEPFKSVVNEVLEVKVSSDQLDVLESKLRKLLLERCNALWTSANGNKQPQDESSNETQTQTQNMIALQHAFTSCINICKEMPLEGLAKLAFVLLEDIVETAPLSLLQQFYEQTQPISLLCRSEKLWNTNKKGGAPVLQFIRVCNQLLKRLPPQSEWTGRVLLQLADHLPLTDRSAIKPWGSVGSNETFSYQDSDQYQGDDGDYTFYQTFWSLQQDFANPYSVSFGTFVAKFQKVLTALEASYSSVSTVDSESLHYLTHSRLLTPLLESSKSLRLHLLTQFCIIEAFLSTQSPNLQSALEALAKRSRALLEKLDENHASHLSKLLTEREIMWRTWKKRKCQPPMQLPSVAPKATDPTAAAPTTVTPTPASNELDFLKPISMHELQDISRTIRSNVPSWKVHLDQYVEALDPEAGIEEEYSPKRDKVMGWQALRLLSQQHLSYFTHIMPNGDFENLVRNVYSKELGEEIPGELLQNLADDTESDNEKEKTTMTKLKDEDIAPAVEPEEMTEMEEADEDFVETTKKDSAPQRTAFQKEASDVTMEDESTEAITDAPGDASGKKGDAEEVDAVKTDGRGEAEEGEEDEAPEERAKRLADMSKFDRANAEEEEELRRTDKEEQAKRRQGEQEKEKGEEQKEEESEEKGKQQDRRQEESRKAGATSKKREEDFRADRKRKDPHSRGNNANDKDTRRVNQDRRQEAPHRDQRQEVGNKRKRPDELPVHDDRRGGGPSPGNRQRGDNRPPHNGRNMGSDQRRHPPAQAMRGPPSGPRGRGGGSHGPPSDNRGRGQPPPPMGRGGGGGVRDDRRGGPHGDRRGGGGGPHDGRDSRRGGGQQHPNRRR